MDERVIIINKDPKMPISEAFRTLRTNVQFLNIDKDIKSILITSSIAGEGKSTVAINLAIAQALTGKKILLIDCDLRKPTIHTYMKVNNQFGLVNLLVQNNVYKEVINSIETVDNLDVLTTGPIPPNPSEILSSNKMKVLLNKVKEDYDVVLLDTPPVGLVTDAAVLSTIADGVILVCAVGEVEVEVSKTAQASLQNVNANILGVVMNKIPLSKSKYYRYNYYHQTEENKSKHKNVVLSELEKFFSRWFKDRKRGKHDV